MALNDESFFNVFGEEVSRTGLVEQMIAYYQLKLTAGETDVNDFNEGSEIRNLLESFAVDLYILMELENGVVKNCFVDSATGEWLDKIGMHPFIKLARDKGKVARGEVTFSLPSATVTDYVVSMGTILVSDSGVRYQTTGECLIPVGETSGKVGAEAITTGSDGNCDSGEITTILDDYVTDDNLSVTNENAFEDGTDYEEDWVYRERLLNYIRADDFGSIGYYTALADNVPGVHDVIFVDDASYTRKILVNGDVKPTPDTVLLEVLTAFSNTNNTVIDHTFTVDKPDYITNNLVVNLTVVTEMDDTIITNIITDFFNGGSHVEGFELPGVNIGQSVGKEDLYSLFAVIDNVVGVEITVGGTEITTLEVDDDEVLKLGTLTVNQTVVE